MLDRLSRRNTARLFNGLSQANVYGDDAQQATNYPVLEIVNDSSQHVKFSRTHDHSTMGVVTDGSIVSTQFDVPAITESGPSHLTVIANGIPSIGVPATVCAPPVISNPSASPNSLWPPNHEFVNVAISYDTSASVCPVTSELTVTSNEIDSDPEWIIVNAHQVQLVSERDGHGRTYTITITTTDIVGEVTTKTVTVVVPHDQA